MVISEYVLLEGAFDNSFNFMLNRIGDALEAAGASPLPESLYKNEYLRERAFSEFIVALEEMGVELQNVDVPLKGKDDAS